jgi:hypothetical protein
MGFITNDEKTHEARITAEGVHFWQRLSKEQEAICIMDSKEWSAEKKLSRMQKLGYTLEEVLDIAFAWDKIDQLGASEFAARYLKLGEQV